MRLFRRRPAPSPALRSVGSAGLYRLGTALLIVTDNRTVSGFWVSTSNVMRLSCDIAAEVLGEHLLNAMAATEIDVPDPLRTSPMAERVGALVKTAGRRSYRSFVRDATHVSLSRDGDIIIVTPSRNGGPIGRDRGFHHLPDLQQSCVATAGETGDTALAALAHATPFTDA